MTRPPNKNIDMKLSVLCAVMERDDTMTLREIADFCECRNSYICDVEKKALEKIKPLMEEWR